MLVHFFYSVAPWVRFCIYITFSI
uniref:Uncharacterized protein n=1 Tax=Arundo donax TaxID=35708 RepID=A0A0A9BBX5_ARUDO